MQWNTDILRRLISPAVPDFLNAEIPDISGDFPEAKFWYSNYFLNSALGPHLNEMYHQLVAVFLVKAQNGFRCYDQAKQLTARYLDGNQSDNPKLGQYLAAVYEWENVAHQCQIAIDVVNLMEKTGGASTKVYKKGDNSPEERCCKISNNIKHIDDTFGSGSAPTNFVPPLWLSNEGLNSYNGLLLTYVECAQILSDVGKMANELQNPVGLKRAVTT